MSLDIIPKIVLVIVAILLLGAFEYYAATVRKQAMERIVGHPISWSDYLLTK